MSRPVGRQGIPCTDHTGRVHESLTAMARRYGLDPQTVKRRLKHGCTLEEALTAERVYKHAFVARVIARAGASTEMLKQHRAKSLYDLAKI